MIQNIEDANYFYWPSIEGSDEMVIKTCENRAGEMYVPLPDVVRERLEWELDAICKHDFSVIFYAMGEVARKAHEEGYVTLTRGATASSFVSYLLGITDINPLPPHYRCKKCKHSEFDVGEGYNIGIELPDKLCSVCGEALEKDGFNLSVEMLLGIDGDKIPQMALGIPPEYSEHAEEHLKELFKNDYVLPAKRCDEYGQPTAFFIAPLERVDDMELSERFLRFSLPCCVESEMLSVLQRVTGIAVSEIPFDDKFDKLLESDRLIASKDDIFQFLILQGMNRNDAYRYMRLCSLGKLGGTKFCDEWEIVARKHNIEECYIESAKKIEQITSMAHLVERALTEYRFLWYKENYPEEFEKVLRIGGQYEKQ